MEESTQKRTRRTPQQMAGAVDGKIAALQRDIAGIEEKRKKANADFDEKVAAVEAKIKELDEKKKAILAPKPPRKTKKQKMEEVVKAAMKSGMNPEEIAEKLGLNQPE